MHEGQRTLIRLLLQELHAFDLFNNLPYNHAIADFMCLQLLLQISRSCSETCTLERIQIELVQEAHMTENSQMVNV